MKLPKKYLTHNPGVMRREIKKHGKKADSDTSAYGPWDADYKSRKAGKGKKVGTKPSKYTSKYKKMYEEYKSNPNMVLNFDDFHALVEMAAYEVFLELEDGLLNEGSAAGSVDNKNSPTYKALKNKSDKSGFPLGILKQVFKRGKSAWKTGHVPGTSPNQWGMARVNSFITGGKTTKMHDKALYQRAKKNRKKKKK